jgi:hypothetical protein
MAGTVALGWGIGSLSALIWSTDPSEGGELGFYAALVLCVLVLLVASGVVLVARVLKIEDDDHPEVPPEARRAR